MEAEDGKEGKRREWREGGREMVSCGRKGKESAPISIPGGETGTDVPILKAKGARSVEHVAVERILEQKGRFFHFLSCAGSCNKYKGFAFCNVLQVCKGFRNVTFHN